MQSGFPNLKANALAAQVVRAPPAPEPVAAAPLAAKKKPAAPGKKRKIVVKVKPAVAKVFLRKKK